MSTSTMDLQAGDDQVVHIAVCPSAGIGHLIPFLRLASKLSSATEFNCRVTFIAFRPTVSAAESNLISSFFSTHPHIICIDFHIGGPPTPSGGNVSDDVPNTSSNETVDPFYSQFEAISRSAHLLGQQLSNLSPKISAVFSDLFVAPPINKILRHQSIPIYVVITTSARFFCLMTHLPHLISSKSPNRLGYNNNDDSTSNIGAGEQQLIHVPGLSTPFPKQSIPSIFSDPGHLFTQLIASNCQMLDEARGFIINTFDLFERETICALRNATFSSILPQIFPVGPLQSFETNKGRHPRWLDNQPAKSVVYACFGSRTAMSKYQIRELGDGLEKCGFRFLWVVKTDKVDKEDVEDIRSLLGEPFFQRIGDRGLVFREWVNQEEILAHPAVGAFLSHCGWNSVMEAARCGMPMVAWPLHGDQKVNAGVVEEAGLGVWERSWGWLGERLIRAEDISNKIQEVMTDGGLRKRACRVGEEAENACDDTLHGSSKQALLSIVHSLKKQGAEHK